MNVNINLKITLYIKNNYNLYIYKLINKNIYLF